MYFYLTSRTTSAVNFFTTLLKMFESFYAYARYIQFNIHVWNKIEVLLTTNFTLILQHTCVLNECRIYKCIFLLFCVVIKLNVSISV